jgi:hypothetical protein
MRTLALLMPAAAMFWSGSASADVVTAPYDPDDPVYYSDPVEFGALESVANMYAPSDSAKPPFKAPFGLQSMTVQWEPTHAAFFVALIWDADGYHWLMASKRSDSKGNPHCWTLKNLGRKFTFNPNGFWLSRKGEFETWYQECAYVPQTVRSNHVTEFVRNAEQFAPAFRNIKSRKKSKFVRGEYDPSYFGNLGEGELNWEEK